MARAGQAWERTAGPRWAARAVGSLAVSTLEGLAAVAHQAALAWPGRPEAWAERPQAPRAVERLAPQPVEAHLAVALPRDAPHLAHQVAGRLVLQLVAGRRVLQLVAGRRVLQLVAGRPAQRVEAFPVQGVVVLQARLQQADGLELSGAQPLAWLPDGRVRPPPYAARRAYGL